MKKYASFMIVFLMCFSAVAFAEEVVSPQGADTIASIFNFLSSIPKIGPIVVTVLNYMGIVAVALTVISSVLMAIKKILTMLAKPESDVLNKIIAVLDKVIPYVAYLSMYNAKK